MIQQMLALDFTYRFNDPTDVGSVLLIGKKNIYQGILWENTCFGFVAVLPILKSWLFFQVIDTAHTKPKIVKDLEI